MFFFRVVTGLKFTKVKQMFHLQIEEGELSSHGSIAKDSRQWVNVPGTEFSYKNKTLIDGVDYHTLTYTARAVDLDNIFAPENMVITGNNYFFDNNS